MIVGIPPQEQGVRPGRALPYELNVFAVVDASAATVILTFVNTGRAAVVFQGRSGNPADLVRTYTVESGKQLADKWKVTSSYSLSVYGPNGFVRYFNGSVGSGAAVLDVSSTYNTGGSGSIVWSVTNVATSPVVVNVLDAYTADFVEQVLQPGESFENELSLKQFYGWYDLVVTVAEDSTFNCRLAGHVETGRDSFSDPALGGLVNLKG